MTPTTLINDLRQRGFTLALAGGALAVRPATALTPADRAAIAVHLPAMVAALAPPSRPTATAWDGRAAVRLLTDADALVERLGVSGTHPDVDAAAAGVCAAYRACDTEALRSAVARFERVVRALARTFDEGRNGRTPLTSPVQPTRA